MRCEYGYVHGTVACRAAQINKVEQILLQHTHTHILFLSLSLIHTPTYEGFPTHYAEGKSNRATPTRTRVIVIFHTADTHRGGGHWGASIGSADIRIDAMNYDMPQ